MRINVAVPEAHVSAPILNSALEAVTRLDESLIRSGNVRPFNRHSPGVKWRPEPPGQEHFDHAALVGKRGWGDCDDLAPWHAASLRVTGRDRGARAIVRRSGPGRWHAVVRRSSGRIDDPSADAGMYSYKRRHGVRGAALPLMSGSVVGAYEARPVLAVRPLISPTDSVTEAWQARLDLPWHPASGTSPADVAMASLHASPVSDQAIVGALEGAIALGEESDSPNEEHLDRMRCLSDMLQGATWADCAREYGPDHAHAASQVVGAFFKKARRKLRKMGRGLARAARGVTRDVVLPLAPMAARMIPGAGPAVSTALQAATPALQQALSRGRHLPPPPLAQFAQAIPGMMQAWGGSMPGMPSMPPMAAFASSPPPQHLPAPPGAFAAFL